MENNNICKKCGKKSDEIKNGICFECWLETVPPPIKSKKNIRLNNSDNLGQSKLYRVFSYINWSIQYIAFCLSVIFFYLFIIDYGDYYYYEEPFAYIVVIFALIIILLLHYPTTIGSDTKLLLKNSLLLLYIVIFFVIDFIFIIDSALDEGFSPFILINLFLIATCYLINIIILLYSKNKENVPTFKKEIIFKKIDRVYNYYQRGSITKEEFEEYKKQLLEKHKL